MPQQDEHNAHAVIRRRTPRRLGINACYGVMLACLLVVVVAASSGGGVWWQGDVIVFLICTDFTNCLTHTLDQSVVFDAHIVHPDIITPPLRTCA